MLKLLSSFLYSIAAPIWAALRDVAVRATWHARGVRIARRAVIVSHARDAIEIGAGSSIGMGALLVCTTERSSLAPHLSRLVIGRCTAINEYCSIRASGGEIRIGSKCLIAQMVSIVASNHSTEVGTPMMDQDWSTSPVSVNIGDDVWIGAGATVLPGSTIGSGAVIAAGAVVRGSVPALEIWGGVPARFIRKRGASASAASKLVATS